ncbi:O-methyltransferase protein [Rutstroemia sp. NJR-2017a BVV2]|nr:O-methyltransferase protein [Rutstroemia sp. NJR-2017a BVV2]
MNFLVKNERVPMTAEQVTKENWYIATPNRLVLADISVERLLRFMGANGMATETSDGKYAASKNTEALDIPGIRAGVGFGMNIVSPGAQALPVFLQRTGYRNPDSIHNCPWYPEHNKDLNVMQYLFSDAIVLQEFNGWMQHQRLNSSTWMDVYPLDVSASSKPDFFVDIGGGLGHMCVALKERFPNISGRVILQDLPGTIDNLSPGQPFAPIAHDYFDEQPVKGAKYYYFRNIMHNLTDESCQKVLAQTKAAMSFDSKILVDDIVVPTQGAHWRTVELDILMMNVLGAIERTEEQWHRLFFGVGLKIAKTYIYDDVQADAVMEVVSV